MLGFRKVRPDREVKGNPCVRDRFDGRTPLLEVGVYQCRRSLGATTCWAPLPSGALHQRLWPRSGGVAKPTYASRRPSRETLGKAPFGVLLLADQVIG